ncbi:ABC transporter substrate-binding protein [Roseburia hominis]
MKRKLLTLLLISAMAVGLLAGCGNSDEKTQKSQEGTKEEKTTDSTFTVAMGHMPSSLQPSAQSSDDLVSAIRPIYEPLFAETRDGLEYYLADSLDISEDGLTYTVHINDKATWSDGEPVTVQDILFTIDYGVLSYGGPTSFTLVNGGEVKFNEVDEKTLEIVLPSVYDNYVRTLSQFYLMPSHAFDDDASKIDDSGYFNSTDMVTSGAYVVSEINEDSLVFKARDDYYRGIPSVETVVMKTIGSGSTKQLEFENGGIDYMRVTSAEDLEKYKAASDKYNLYTVSEARLNYLQLNPNGAVMSTLSADARKAIFIALNQEEIIDFAWGSDELAVPANSLLTPDQSIYNKDCAGYKYDLEEAKALAKSSGLEGKTLTYIYNSDRSNMEAVATVVQQQLAAIGVNVVLEGCDSATFFPRFFTKKDSEQAATWDLGTNGWDSQRGSNCGQTISYLTNRLCDCGFSEEVSGLATTAMGTADAAKKQEIWNEIQDKALAEYWEYPLTYTNYVMVSQWNVTGLDGSPVIPEFIDYLSIHVE